MRNEKFIVRMFDKRKKNNNGWKWYSVKMFIILFTRCLSVHLLKCFHINLRSICNVLVFCEMVHL